MCEGKRAEGIVQRSLRVYPLIFCCQPRLSPHLRKSHLRSSPTFSGHQYPFSLVGFPPVCPRKAGNTHTLTNLRAILLSPPPFSFADPRQAPKYQRRARRGPGQFLAASSTCLFFSIASLYHLIRTNFHLSQALKPIFPI